MADTTSVIIPLEAHKNMKSLLASYYSELEQARDRGRKIVWATGQAPTDLFVAMDILPAYPENHAAICGTRRVGTQLCELSEEHDYSIDLCSYARNSLGSCMLDNKDFPVAPLPAPDILIAVTMCNTHTKWWEVLSRYYNVPLLLLETPFVHDDLGSEDIKMAITYVENQLREMIKFLAAFCGRPYNYDRLQESVANSSKCGSLYAEFVSMCQHVPSPITSFDTFMDLMPMMDLRGFPEAVDYYDAVLAEVRQRVEESISAVGQELHRLYWDNIPVWYRVGWMARKLASYGACTVAATYPWGWINAFARLDSERPLETIAESQALYYQNKGTRSRIEFLVKLIEDFSVDGLLAQASFSCKAFVPDQAVIIKEAQKLTGVPAVLFEGDMVDERLYSDAQVSKQLEAFMNMLATRGHG